ncbi:hypothetical protein [Clostridium hydrogenum]|uniref:hypothetical protein n=1 Tax=Clostridium hydrogenum TaxID=2855764 RepID=UPI001F28DAB3|nr:hypothetical protein [Clostridium hydrogenum]
MDINNVMNTYNMTSLWNSMNSLGTSGSSSVPLVDNVDSAVEENYAQANYFGQNTNSELQNIYNQVEPTYGIPLTYDSSGNITSPTTTTLPSPDTSTEYSNILPLIQSSESTSELNSENILNEYDSIENGTYQENLSSILASNSNGTYNSDSSIQNNETQSTGNYLDYSV